jgi:hypothetical protein
MAAIAIASDLIALILMLLVSFFARFQDTPAPQRRGMTRDN